MAAHLAPAQEGGEVDAIPQLIRDASRALQSGNAPLFLACFDRREMPDFSVFRDQVMALTAQRRIASSVETGIPRKTPEEWTVSVNWLLELTPRLDPGPLERRHQTLTVGLRRPAGRWRIVRVEPSGFFAAVRQSAP